MLFRQTIMVLYKRGTSVSIAIRRKNPLLPAGYVAMRKEQESNLPLLSTWINLTGTINDHDHAHDPLPLHMFRVWFLKDALQEYK